MLNKKYYSFIMMSKTIIFQASSLCSSCFGKKIVAISVKFDNWFNFSGALSGCSNLHVNVIQKKLDLKSSSMATSIIIFYPRYIMSGVFRVFLVLHAEGLVFFGNYHSYAKLKECENFSICCSKNIIHVQVHHIQIYQKPICKHQKHTEEKFHRYED